MGIPQWGICPPPSQKNWGKGISGKYHVKFGIFVNFSYTNFRAKMFCPKKLTELLRLCTWTILPCLLSILRYTATLQTIMCFRGRWSYNVISCDDSVDWRAEIIVSGNRQNMSVDGVDKQVHVCFAFPLSVVICRYMTSSQVVLVQLEFQQNGKVTNLDASGGC